MSEDFQVQCEVCGTIYNDLEEVCPYCGTPQPESAEPSEQIIVEETLYPQEVYLEEEPLPDEPPEEEAYYPGLEPEPPEEESYFDDYPAAAPFVEDDDIFAVAGESEEEPYEAVEPDLPAGAYADDLAKPVVYEDELDPAEALYDEEEEVEATPRFQRRGRLLLGCLGAFICIGVLYSGIGVLAAYNGLQERAADVQSEAQESYQRGQGHLATGNIELAIAEFERALSLNPNLLDARESLREAQRIVQSQPTPTSETRSAAAASLLEQAEAEVSAEQWAEAFETLSQVRDLNPDYQPDWVSELYYEASYQHGLALIEAEKVDEALAAFEQALEEQPDDVAVLAEKAKASIYLAGREAAETTDFETAVENFRQIYDEAPAYLDVTEQLWRAYEHYGDQLATDEAWCEAEAQFVEATLLAPDNALLQRKAEASRERCEESGGPTQPSAPPTRTSVSPSPTTPSVTRPAAAAGPAAQATSTPQTAAPPPATGAASGTIYFSMYNPNETRWEVLAVPAAGGATRVMVTQATMPAVSPNGQLLLYRSEDIDSEGFHIFNLATGEDKRISILRQDILPRWGGDNSQFLFVAQEPATGRWLVQLGFADGKGEAQILRDGRTPDWSPNGNLIAYQGTDAQGNNPGLYVVPFSGGDTQRVTTHESDRSPDFSPNGSQLAYMSTQAGNWDIYTVNASGGSPRQVTTYAGNDGLPAWSPDGSKIAYVSDAGGSWGIYVIEAGGGTPQRVTNWDGNRADWLLAQIWWGQ